LRHNIEIWVDSELFERVGLKKWQLNQGGS
jgi:hypothetical protein